VGCLFAIDRKYFWEIGGYDDLMDGWGGENLELSFRVWQCGGTLELIPCSHVGHIFRKYLPYGEPHGIDTFSMNTIRLAKVWMDEYIEYFYLNRPELRNTIPLLFGDISGRQLIREKLQCKSFDWFLRTVYPEKLISIENVKMYGRVSTLDGKFCLDDSKQVHRFLDWNTNFLSISECHRPNVSVAQAFSLTNAGVFRNEFMCARLKFLGILPLKYKAFLNMCHRNDAHNDKWEITDAQQIRHIASNVCLDYEGLNNRDHVPVVTCDSNKQSQKWLFEK